MPELVREISAIRKELELLTAERAAVDQELNPWLKQQRRKKKASKKNMARKKKRAYQELLPPKVSGGLPGLGKRR